MPVGAAIGGAAVIGAVSSERAAGKMADAQRGANALNRAQWNYIRGQTEPWVQGGYAAFDQLMQSYGVGGQAPDMTGFYDSPDYQFALGQGTQAMDRSAAASGRLYSGAQMKGLQEYGQGLATQYLGNYRSGLSGIAGMGQNALGALSGQSNNYTQNAMAGAQNMGNISAARQLGYGSAGMALAGAAAAGNYGGGQSSYSSGTVNSSGATNGLNLWQPTPYGVSK